MEKRRILLLIVAMTLAFHSIVSSALSPLIPEPPAAVEEAPELAAEPAGEEAPTASQDDAPVASDPEGTELSAEESASNDVLTKGIEIIPPKSEAGYYLNTGVMMAPPAKSWSGGNAATGIVGGQWSDVSRFSYREAVGGMLLTSWVTNTLTSQLTEGDYVWEMDCCIDTEANKNGTAGNQFQISLYSSDGKFHRPFTVENEGTLYLNGKKQNQPLENKKWYILRAVLSQPSGIVNAYVFDKQSGALLYQSEDVTTNVKDFSYVRWGSTKVNSVAYLQNLKFYKNGADTGEEVSPFHHISGAESIYIPNTGTENATYQIFAGDNTPMPEQEAVSWRLEEAYPGVTLSGSTVIVSAEAQAGEILLYAAYQDKELSYSITLTKSLYGKDFAAGKELKYYAAANKDQFSNRSGEGNATDSNPETFYTTGTMQTDPQNKGGQIIPMLMLDKNTKYNVVRIKHELTATSDAPSSLRLVYAQNGGSSSGYKELVSPSILDFKSINEFDRYIKVPVRTEQYLGFHLNTGTSATGKWIPELKIYDFEVYYDGSQLNGLALPPDVTADRDFETRVPITAIDADGNVMTDLSGYFWKGSPLLGSENVSVDEATGELVVASDATLGTYAVTLTSKENPELTLTTTININIPEEEMPDYFHSISGSGQVVIPKQGNAEIAYSVLDKDGVNTGYSSLITWALARQYRGVALNGSTLSVGPEAEPGTVTLLAKVKDYQLSFDISLTTASASVNGLISLIEGDKFVVSPYYGEQAFSTAQYRAKAYDLTELAEGVKWSVKGAPPGVSIEENTGVLSVPPNTNDCKIKVIAEKDGVSAEKLVTLVSRYDGAPNLLRLPGVSISKYADEGQPLASDGDFSTRSTTEIFANAKYANITLPKNYHIDTFRAYKDFGGFANSYQTTARVNGVAFGGKGWSNSPLEADIWVASPGFDTNVFQYSFIPREHATDVYEMELYSSYMRFDRIESDKDRVDIPAGGAETVQLTALAENGTPVEPVEYADGESHAIKWELAASADGVLIDEHTGVLTVTPQARPTTVTVRGIYFGRIRYKAICIGGGTDASVLAQMDYDWLTLEKLTHESPDNITYKMLLYNAAPNGSAIEWHTSSPKYLTATGDVYLPYTEGDVNATLTATIKNGDAAPLTKAFDVTIRTPEDFIDKNIVTDRELFGLWDPEYEMWAVTGKLDYDVSPEFAPIEEAVKAYDYARAKELLYDITITRLKNTDAPPNISENYKTPTAELYRNSTSLYTTKAANFITIGNERAWYSADVLGLIQDSLSFTMVLHSEMKEDALVEVDSKESGFKPYILVKLKNGNEMKFEAQKDTTIRAGYYVNENYGSDSVLRVMDSGYPIDSNTQRGYLGFDLSAIPNVEDVSSAQLYLHAENTAKTGSKRVAVLYFDGSVWDENDYSWSSTKGSMALFSYSGTKGGFEFSYPPGGDPEVLLNQIGRLYHLHSIASGYAATGDEKYAYSVLDLLDGFYDHAGENNSYPRGFDGYERNQRFMSSHKLIADSKYMTPEVTTYFWKHLWELHNQVSISRDPFFNEVDNMMISMTDQTISFLAEFKEFHDTPKWLGIYVGRMLPLLKRVIFDDGSYSESSDAYAYSSIQTFASSVEKANKIGISLGDQFNDRIHKNLYFYSSMLLPNFTVPGYGDSNPAAAGKQEDSFLLNMANLFHDDVLKYMGANGKKGGAKPDFTSTLYPDTRRVYMRADWTDDAPYLMTNIDDAYASHGHKDDLSVICWAYGDFVITDTGRYNYTWSDPVNIELLSSQNHNTLGRITDLKANKVYMQSPSGEKDKTQVRQWATGSDFDSFSGNTKEELYVSGKPMKTGYNRKILFVKPDYWIVSDLVEDREPAGKSDQKYDVMFHLLPGNNHTIDNESKIVKTDFDGATNVQLLSPDADVSIAREDAIYAPVNGSYTTTDRIVFSKTKPASEKTTFDTVVFPTRSGDTSSAAAVERIEMDVPSSVASAMHISRSGAGGTFDDYYYYSNETAFKDVDTLPTRTFGAFSYDGELAFASYNRSNQLDSFYLVNGKTLRKDGETVAQADHLIADIGVSFDNAVMNVSSSAKTVEELGGISINAGRLIEKVLFNGKPAGFSQYGNTVVIGANTFIIDPGGEEIVLPQISYGNNFAYDGNTYAVSVQIPEGTKIQPIDHWDGRFRIDIESARPGETIAGRVMIKTEDGRALEFITPISVSVPGHASASVALVIDGKEVAQSQKLSSKEPQNAKLPPGSAGLYTLRDNLWVITNECGELVIGRIEIPVNPSGPGEGGNSGGGNPGGDKPGGNKPGGNTPGGNTPGGNTPGGEQPEKPPFDDLTDALWAEASITALYNKGIVNGKADGKFAPHDPVTRAEFTTILARAFALNAEPAVTQFDDVQQEQWYTEPIAVASALGVVRGITENTFGVDAPITRQDMMVMLYRLMQKKGIVLEKIRDAAELTDLNEAADYAKEAIEAMYCAGVINGVGDGRIAPQATAERAEVAKMVYEVLAKIETTQGER